MICTTVQEVSTLLIDAEMSCPKGQAKVRHI